MNSLNIQDMKDNIFGIKLRKYNQSSFKYFILFISEYVMLYEVDEVDNKINLKAKIDQEKWGLISEQIRLDYNEWIRTQHYI